MISDLKGKVALISGAGHGLGQVLARSFGSLGVIVAVNDINPDRASRTVTAIEKTGGVAKAYLTDISKKMPVQAMVNEIEDDWGRLDILVNNAAVRPNKLLVDMDEWDWRRVVDVNLTGPFLLSQVAARVMRSLGNEAVMINICSTSGYALAAKGYGAYAATKGALKALTRAAAQEFAEYGIRVYGVCAGDLEDGLEVQDRVPVRLPEFSPFSGKEVVETVLYLAAGGSSDVDQCIFGG